MLILGLNGSPQKEGNTVTMLHSALESAAAVGAETRTVHITDALKDLKNPFCYNCSPVCEGVCAKGNTLGEAMDLLRQADGIIIGSPVYFGTVTGQLKAFWDKTRGLRKEKALMNVVGGVVVVGGSRFGGQETTISSIHDMMFVHGMTVVGDGYIDDDAGHQGACAQRPAAEDQLGLKRAAILGKRVAKLAEATINLRKR